MSRPWMDLIVEIPDFNSNVSSSQNTRIFTADTIMPCRLIGGIVVVHSVKYNNNPIVSITTTCLQYEYTHALPMELVR